MPEYFTIEDRVFPYEYVKGLYKKLRRAYRDAKRKKGRTPNAISFESNCEDNLFNLMVDILLKKYKILPFNTFIATRPVKREIFAAKFPDRIIHHWIMNEIGEIIEAQFIYDSYACRKEKGTLFGIERLYDNIRKCSRNFNLPVYALKLDIRNFFMSLDRRRVWDNDDEVNDMISQESEAETDTDTDNELSIDDIIRNDEEEIRVINRLDSEHLITPEVREYIKAKYKNDMRRAWMAKRDNK